MALPAISFHRHEAGGAAHSQSPLRGGPSTSRDMQLGSLLHRGPALLQSSMVRSTSRGRMPGLDDEMDRPLLYQSDMALRTSSAGHARGSGGASLDAQQPAELDMRRRDEVDARQRHPNNANSKPLRVKSFSPHTSGGRPLPPGAGGGEQREHRNSADSRGQILPYRTLGDRHPRDDRGREAGRGPLGEEPLGPPAEARWQSGSGEVQGLHGGGQPAAHAPTGPQPSGPPEAAQSSVGLRGPRQAEGHPANWPESSARRRDQEASRGDSLAKRKLLNELEQRSRESRNAPGGEAGALGTVPSSSFRANRQGDYRPPDPRGPLSAYRQAKNNVSPLRCRPPENCQFDYQNNFNILGPQIRSNGDLFEGSNPRSARLENRQ